MTKVRVNLANPAELCAIPGLQQSQAEAIVKFRATHGPIENLEQLTAIIGHDPLPAGANAELDFSPAAPTAPEAPGA